MCAKQQGGKVVDDLILSIAFLFWFTNKCRGLVRKRMSTKQLFIFFFQMMLDTFNEMDISSFLWLKI